MPRHSPAAIRASIEKALLHNRRVTITATMEGERKSAEITGRINSQSGDLIMLVPEDADSIAKAITIEMKDISAVSVRTS